MITIDDLKNNGYKFCEVKEDSMCKTKLYQKRYSNEHGIKHFINVYYTIWKINNIPDWLEFELATNTINDTYVRHIITPNEDYKTLDEMENALIKYWEVDGAWYEEYE